MADNKCKGNLGEDAAAQYLSERGYEILCRNYRIRDAEIDIVAYKDGTIIFAEVKLRKNNRMGAPAEAVNAAKQRRIISAAEGFIAKNNITDKDFRFDVLEVYYNGSSCRVNHIENAFWL